MASFSFNHHCFRRRSTATPELKRGDCSKHIINVSCMAPDREHDDPMTRKPTKENQIKNQAFTTHKESILQRRINMLNAPSDNQDMEKSSKDEYEVFLSFRGPDTRTDITDYLYESMIDAGIRTYKDDEELRIGEEISGPLFRAIEQSTISIPIFSKGYADSTWCLRELAKIVECKNTRRHKIKPIYFDVPPSEVKYQTEHYGIAIVSHKKKKRFDDETIDKWKAALAEVGELKGWDLQSKPDRGKGDFVKEVITDILIELKTAYLEVSDGLVAVDNHVTEIMRMISRHNYETKIVGIHGMGGMGKTTLAKIVYNQLSHDFPDCCCFLSNIRETEITHLQKQLISDICKKKVIDINNITEGKKEIKKRLSSKKVLLLLDDADNASQLDALVQKLDRFGEKSNWFGEGSKIIITTRDKGILNVPTLVDETYELTGMNFDHSLQLFSIHAFRRNYPLGQYIYRSKRAVDICGGLPLALEVVGSLLSGKSAKEWDLMLKELEESPQGDVEKKLIISIETLNQKQRKIFLDIACFFIGYDIRIVTHMWGSCGFLHDQSLQILQQRSLIKIRDDNQLWMHDWLRDIGRNSIKKESDMKPEKQRWVWTHAQALEVLEKTQIGSYVPGIEDIEAICLELDESLYSIRGCLSRFLNLRFLRVESTGFMECTKSTLHTASGPRILPVLRWLSWRNINMDFDVANFSLRKLVILDLSMSNITEEWDGWSHIKLAKNLKVLNLTGCTKLRKTPDLSSLVDLERLMLEGCESLVQIDPSIGHLKNLVFLNMKYCHGLQELPDEMGALESLTELLLDGTSILKIPEWRRMEKLEILSLRGCMSLREFNFVGCAASSAELSSVDNPLTRLPQLIGNSNSLIELDLLHTKAFVSANSIANMRNLKVLKMQWSSIKEITDDIGMLEKPRFSRILSLNPTEIPALPQLPQSLIDLDFTSDSMVTVPDLSNLTNLRSLSIRLGKSEDRPNLEETSSGWWIGRLRMLEILELFCDGITSLPSDIVLLSQLKVLVIWCRNLQCLPMLPTGLLVLRIIECDQMKTIKDLSNLKALAELRVDGCHELTEIPGIEGLENLRTLYLTDLPSLVKLPNLTNLNKLKTIYLKSCPELVEVPGALRSLETLDIIFCPRLQLLPDPSVCENLDVVIF